MAGLLLFRSPRRLRVAAIFFRRLCAGSRWQERSGRAEFALADPYVSLSIPHESRQIKSPNSGSRTPRNSQKTNNGHPLKSPKISILQNQKSHRNRSIDHKSQRISNRLAQSVVREGFGLHKPISNRLAQSAFCEGFGLRQHISNRFYITNRIHRNSLKTNDRDISNRF
jgi:hypothetical protein